MDEATLALTIMTGLILISFIGFLVWGMQSGQFKNSEDAKYQIFRDNRTPDTFAETSEEGHGTRGGKIS